MKKKLLSLLCGVTMLAAALTGCGNQSADTPASSEGETTESACSIFGGWKDRADHYGFHRPALDQLK